MKLKLYGFAFENRLVGHILKKIIVVFQTRTIKREFRHFHVVVVQKRQGNVHKSVMRVRSCCFAY